MERTEASTSSYTALIAQLRGEKRLAALTAPEYDPALGHFVVVDLEVDLEQAYWQAIEKKAKTLSVFADKVWAPETFNHAIGDDLRLVSVIARAVEVKGTRAILRLKHAPAAAAPATGEGATPPGAGLQPTVRILADEINGEFLVYAPGHAAGRKQLTAAARTEPLRFTSYTCNESGLVRTQGKLPLSMLDLGSPLYQTLTASLDLAAGAMRRHPAEPEQSDLARAILNWLVRWAAYPSPYLARLFDDAQALSRLATIRKENSQIVYNIPPRTPREYLDLAANHLAVAEKYELDEGFKDVQGAIKEVVGRLVQAWAARDSADLSALDEEIDQAKKLTEEARAAVQKAARELQEQQFETTMQGIRLEGALAQDRIVKILKATIEILQGVVQLGASIAAVGANPGMATAVSNLNPFTWMQTAGAFGGDRAPLWQRLGMTLALLYALPKSLYDEYKSMDADDKAQLNKDLAAMGPPVLKLFGAAMTLMKIDKPGELVSEIGNLVSHAAGVPDTIESKAVWEAFEAEAVNQLEIISRDQEAAAAVVSAAAAYKTCIQKFAIYGRLYSEQQAMLAQRIRELGALLIRKGAAEQKQATLLALHESLSERDQVVETLSRLRTARLYELRQSFFAALCRYRAAYFYENLEWPAKMPALVLPANGGEMKEMTNDIARALESVPVQTPGEFTKVREIRLSEHPDFFQDLQKSQGAKFQLALDDQDLFEGHCQVRLNRVRAWLIGAAQKLITVELLSEASFQDRRTSSQSFSFSGDPVFLSFEYKGDVVEFDPVLAGVRPTPFSTWTLTVKGKSLDLEKVTQVNIELFGNSVKKRS